MKNLDALIDKYEAMEPLEVENKLIENFGLCLRLLKKASIKMESLGVEGLDAEDLMRLSLEAALGWDSRVDSEEYNLYIKLLDKFGIEKRTLDELRETARTQQQLLVDTISSVYGVLPTMGGIIDEEIEPLYIEVLVGAISANGSIDSAEYQAMLKVISAGDTSTESSATPINNLSRDDASPLTVSEMGATSTVRSDGSYYFSVGATIKNPNKKHLALDSVIKVIVMDANGKVLNTSNETIQYIDVDSVFCYGEEFYISNGHPNNYKVLVEADEFMHMDNGNQIMDGITISNYNLSKDRWNSLTLTGNITNRYKKRISWLTVYTVFRDSDRTIVGGTNFHVHDLFSGSVDGFDTTLNITADISTIKASVDFDVRDQL